MATTNLGLPTILGTNTADVVRDMNALAEAVDVKAGAIDGLATLGADGKVPAGQLPPSNATASAIEVADAGAYYTATNAEGALQEIGQTLNAVRGDLVTSVNMVLGS
ncbi:MAG TPA: hypothetical protein VHP30_15580 [Ignavibacteriales bacterium]|nr:hypothetical protein [Ignavibacteriales bacterium]